MADPLEQIARIIHVEILEPGTSGKPAGQEIQVVRRFDPDVAETPRRYIVDRIIEPHGGELAGVSSVRVHYNRLPLPQAIGTVEVQLPAPHDRLLVIDGAIQPVERMNGMNQAA